MWRTRSWSARKVVPEHASYQGTLRACEQSLRRLRTDRLDSYLLHWPGRRPIAETIRAFDHLERTGKIRSWGVSNFDVADLTRRSRSPVPIGSRAISPLPPRRAGR